MIETVQLEDIQLEEEYIVAFRQSFILPCIEALAKAILEQALQDAVDDKADMGLLKKEAMHWINMDDFDYSFSFRCICEMLEINPYAIRNTVKKKNQYERGDKGGIHKRRKP